MNEFPRTLKIATVWLLLGVGVFLGIRSWEHNQQQSRFQASGGVIEIRRGPDGHYHWPGSINGLDVDFLIDTGATGTAMSQAMARELGLQAVGRVQSNTAGGVVTGEVVRADVVLQGGVRVERLAITALAGLSDRPLLGMDVLGKLHWRQRDGLLTIDTGAGR
ncbi:MAG: retroviral-like aspartic protease family protein [Rhizobacter sp.]|nr:retroviral-like aspartic protease family protein [Rhizobacter sp.]